MYGIIIRWTIIIVYVAYPIFNSNEDSHYHQYFGSPTSNEIISNHAQRVSEGLCCTCTSGLEL